MSKLPSPSIGVCKFRREGHCIGCSMTRSQKKTFKKLKKKKKRREFIKKLVEQQTRLGKYDAWAGAYLLKCSKKGSDPRRVGLG
ncbi:MAG: DUF1289 domain-containing protein [Pseudomonadota bacterium]